MDDYIDVNGAIARMMGTSEDVELDTETDSE